MEFFFKEEINKYYEPSSNKTTDLLIDENNVLKYMEWSKGINFFANILEKIMQDKDWYSDNPKNMDNTLRLAFWVTNIATLENLPQSSMDILLTSVRYSNVCNFGMSEKLRGILSVGEIRTNNLLKDYSEDDKQLIEFLIQQYTLSEKENEEALKKVVFFKRKKYRMLLNCIRDAEKLTKDTFVKGLVLDSSKRLENVASEFITEKSKFNILIVNICKKMLPGFKEAYQSFNTNELSGILEDKCNGNIMEFIIQIEQWRKSGLLKYYKQEGLSLVKMSEDELKAISQIKIEDYEEILAQGYNLSYKDFLKVISMYPSGVLEKLRSENMLTDIFSYDTLGVYNKKNWYEYGMQDYMLLEKIQQCIFDPKKNSEIRSNFMLYKLANLDNSYLFDEFYVSRGFWKIDIKKGKDDYEDINKNPKYEGSVDDDAYQTLWQNVRVNGFEIGEEEFKEKYKYYEFMFATDIDMKLLRECDISQVYKIYNMLCYASEKAKVKKGIDIKVDTDLVYELLNWNLEQYKLLSFEQFEIVYGIVTENPVTKDSRLLNYLNNKNRYFKIKKIEDLDNYNAYCINQIPDLKNYNVADMINRYEKEYKRGIFLQSLFGSCIPEKCRNKYDFCTNLVSELYFYQKYKKNGDFKGVVEDTDEEREIDQIISEIISIMNASDDDFSKGLYDFSRLLREKYIDIPAIMNLVNERMERVSKKNIVEELGKTKKMIENLPVQYIKYEGMQVPIKVLDGDEFCLAISTLSPKCSPKSYKLNYDQRREQILNSPLHSRHSRVSFINHYMLSRAVPVSKELEVAYTYFPDSPESIEMTADRDLRTSIINDENGDTKVVSSIGINQNRKLIDIINTTGYAEHNEGVFDNVLPQYIVCFDEMSETALKKYNMLKEQGHTNIELLVIKVKEKYLPRMEAKFNQDIEYIRNEIAQINTLSEQTIDTFFNEYENNMCIRALQLCLTGEFDVREKLPQLRDLLMEMAKCIPKQYIGTLIRQIHIIYSLEEKMYSEGVADYYIFGGIKREKLYSEECFEEVEKLLENRLRDVRSLV